MTWLDALNADITVCRRCPRLVEWRERVGREKRRAYAEDIYWAKPVPIFGDPDATRLIVGLAPAAHGANRTGRMFHGDRSGEWLFRALHKAGIASRATAASIDDGQTLDGVAITAVCHCAPPDNSPSRDEIRNCSAFLAQVLARPWISILCLGGIAWRECRHMLGLPSVAFAHGVTSGSSPRLVASYHPSQQNTFTGRLTEPMLDEAVARWLAD